jgi:hypothetical protein
LDARRSAARALAASGFAFAAPWLVGASCGVVLLCIALRFVWDVPLRASDTHAVLAACACGAVTSELYGFLLRRESGYAPPAGPTDSTS